MHEELTLFGTITLTSRGYTNKESFSC